MQVQLTMDLIRDEMRQVLLETIDGSSIVDVNWGNWCMNEVAVIEGEREFLTEFCL